MYFRIAQTLFACGLNAHPTEYLVHLLCFVDLTTMYTLWARLPPKTYSFFCKKCWGEQNSPPVSEKINIVYLPSYKNMIKTMTNHSQTLDSFESNKYVRTYLFMLAWVNIRSVFDPVFSELAVFFKNSMCTTYLIIWSNSNTKESLNLICRWPVKRKLTRTKSSLSSLGNLFLIIDSPQSLKFYNIKVS
jgi:hypothetical protein